jgi:tetratricopeptide (TPR) repeat protein
MAFYHRGMGDLAYLHSDFATAREHFQTSVELSQSVPQSWLETYALCGLGRSAVELGQYEVALEHLTKALQLSQQLDNLQLFMIAFAGMASLHDAKGEHEHAIELCSYVLQHFASWNETKQLAVRISQGASSRVPAEVAEAAKQKGKNANLENLVNRYLEKE